MTNDEKFYEIFGVHMETGASLCDICECNGPCKKCSLYGHGDDCNQYVEPKEVLRAVASPSKSFGKDKPVMVNAKQIMLDSLSKESEIVLATAYSYAKNLTTYGINVTEKWNNVLENTREVQAAYSRGYFDALSEMNNNKNRDSDKGKWIDEPNCYVRCSCCSYHYPHTSLFKPEMDWKYCPNCGTEMEE